MNTFRRPHFVSLSVLLFSLSASFAAAAQGPAVPPPVKQITVPCCKCVDGSTQTVSINTGATPWTMKGPTGPAVPAQVTSHVAWTTAAAPAKWVGTQAGQPGTYIFELPFYLPNCVIKASVTVAGVFSADNGAVLVVDTPSPAFNAPPPTAFTSTFAFTKAITTPGLHTIRVSVKNNEGPTGTVVRGTITVRCPKDPVITRSDVLEAAPDRGDVKAVPLPEGPGTD
jgi:hypothetical protein